MKWIEATAQLPEGSMIIHTPSGEIWQLMEYCKNFDSTQQVHLLQHRERYTNTKMWVNWEEIKPL